MDRRRGLLMQTGGTSIQISLLPVGSKVKDSTGAMMATIISQDHNTLDSGYPANATTLWSDLSAGTARMDYDNSTGATYIRQVAAAYTTPIDSILLSCTVKYSYYHSGNKLGSYTGTKFPLSSKELSNGYDGTTASGVRFPYFNLNIAPQAERIRYLNGTAVYYWTRDSAYSESTYYVLVKDTGNVNTSATASTLYNIFPAFNIPNTTLVSAQPDSDGYYIII